tara:strand:- start:8231 stop:8920 length:690 start_codon:yes stop_codon:yes gene_type:complete
MKESISRLSSIERERTSGEVRAGTESPESPDQCTCQRCGLYRWYPPLMLMTTALAAVFCWMYITKPVFLSAPSDQSLNTQPAIQEKRPIREDEPTPHTAGGGNLDPAIARLPGDPVLPDDSSARDGIPGEELKPLIVKRQGPSLFRAIPPDEIPERKEIVLEAPGSGVVAEAGSEQDEDQVPEEEVVSLVAGEEGDQDSGSEEFRVHASFMAEFSSVQQEGDRQPDLKP